ncbi:hypothetical protein BVRB_023760, partial [Beta vulgaris subsp. vulgaris]
IRRVRIVRIHETPWQYHADIRTGTHALLGRAPRRPRRHHRRPFAVGSGAPAELHSPAPAVDHANGAGDPDRHHGRAGLYAVERRHAAMPGDDGPPEPAHGAYW